MCGDLGACGGRCGQCDEDGLGSACFRAYVVSPRSGEEKLYTCYRTLGVNLAIHRIYYASQIIPTVSDLGWPCTVPYKGRLEPRANPRPLSADLLCTALGNFRRLRIHRVPLGKAKGG